MIGTSKARKQSLSHWLIPDNGRRANANDSLHTAAGRRFRGPEDLLVLPRVYQLHIENAVTGMCLYAEKSMATHLMHSELRIEPLLPIDFGAEIVLTSTALPLQIVSP